MARSNLWTPLVAILVIQVLLLLYLNLKTSAPTNGDLVSVHISAPDSLARSRDKTRGSLVKIQNVNVVQIEAPASEISRDKRSIDEQTLMLGGNVQIDAPIKAGERRLNNGAAAAGWESQQQKPRGIDGRNTVKLKSQNGSVSVSRDEFRKRSDDDEQLIGEREKANARDMKGGMSKESAVHNSRKQEAMEDRGILQAIDSKADHARDNVPNDSRRKINQVSMLKSHDSDEAPAAGGQKIKKPPANEKREREAVNMGKLTHDDFMNHVQRSLAVNGKGDSVKQDKANTTRKRNLIDKVSQLKMRKAANGKLRDMPFMPARRTSYQGNGGKPPKFNYKQAEDFAKYANEVDYFEEFCKEVSEPLVECSKRKARELTDREQDGQNIMFTLRTTSDYHDERLPILFETWLSVVDPRTVFLVTDGEDAELDDITENIGQSLHRAHVVSLAFLPGSPLVER